MSAILDVLSRFNPTGFAQQNELQAGAIKQQAQQTKALQLENTIRQRQLNDQDALTQAWRDIDQAADPETQQRQLIGGLVKHNATGTAITTQIRDYGQMRAQLATATKDELANAQTIHEGDAGAIDSIVNGPPADAPQSWRDFYPTFQSHHPNLQIPAEYPGAAAATSLGNRSRLMGAIAETNLKRAQTGAEAAKATESTALGNKANLDAQILQERLDRMKAAAQQGGDSFIDQEIDPTKSPSHKSLNQAAHAQYQQMLRSGAPLDEAVKAVEPFAKGAEELEREMDPRVLAARRHNAVLQKQELDQLEASQAGDAFSGILNSKQRGDAMADYKKYSDDYVDKLGSARQLQDFVAAAQSGNKAAPGFIPMAEVRQLLNRVNSQELRSVSTAAGSAWDRLVGLGEGIWKGENIPPEVLKDIATVSKNMEGAARRTYDYHVAVNRSTYKSKAQPIDVAPYQPINGQPAVTATPARGASFTDADVTAAMSENRGLSRAQIEKRFTDEGFVKK